MDIREMSIATRVFTEYYSNLVETLPMSTTFVAKLHSCGIISRKLKNKLNLLQGTREDKATVFLDSVIEPSVISGVGSSFDKLLHVIEDSEYQHVKELAKEIRTSLWMGSTSDEGL